MLLLVGTDYMHCGDHKVNKASVLDSLSDFYRSYCSCSLLYYSKEE
jgi:hypothetical protein